MIFRWLAGLLLISMVSLFSICALSLAVVGMAGSGSCGMAHDATVCPMMVDKHLLLWQQIFLEIGLQRAVTCLLLAAILIIAWGQAAQPRVWPILAAWAHYIRDHAAWLVFDYLRRQFSLGILHPKIY